MAKPVQKKKAAKPAPKKAKASKASAPKKAAKAPKKAAAKVEKVPAKPVFKAPPKPRRQQAGDQQAGDPQGRRQARGQGSPFQAGTVPAPVKIVPLNPDFLEKQKQRLIELRDHLLNQMQGVAQDTLRVRAEGSEASAFGMHQADAGSDAYDKDFALSLLSQEQDALYEIEEALKRVENGTYGTCEMSNRPIPKIRLEAIPHARFTVECQAQLERENKGRRRWDTIPQFMDSAETLVDEDDDASEEDDRRKKED